MTPKQKAIELTNKFCSYVEGYFGSKKNMIAAKKAALIAVDEIIDSYTKEKSYGYIISDKIIPYWKDVKQEIEKL
jgi:hypothetical protein